MTKEHPATWQKVAIIIAVLTFTLPAGARFAWQVIFPANYLLYETTHTTRTDAIQTATAIVTNDGSATQRDVAIYLPVEAMDPAQVKVEVSSPRTAGLRSIFEAQAKVPLQKYAEDTGSKIPLGNIAPGQEVRVTFVATADPDSYLRSLSLSDMRVESSTSSAIEADGVRRPSFNEDWHTSYMQAAPYILAFLLGILGLFLIVGLIYDIFFETPQKKMARLWRQMDTLQEKIDKERRYQ